ncbi:unnamed protein product [Scytosiphon promiscuus]
MMGYQGPARGRRLCVAVRVGGMVLIQQLSRAWRSAWSPREGCFPVCLYARRLHNHTVQSFAIMGRPVFISVAPGWRSHSPSDCTGLGGGSVDEISRASPSLTPLPTFHTM